MTTYIGIDVAKATLAVALWRTGPAERVGTFANTPAGWEALASALEQRRVGEEGQWSVVLEPTGGYEVPLALWARARGWRVSLPHPLTVRRWAAGIGQRAKTDQQDARLLAQYGAERHPAEWTPLAQEVSELEAWLGRRRDLEQWVQQEQRRLEQWRERPGIPAGVLESIERHLEQLEAERAAVEAAIAAHLAQHQVLTEQYQQVQTVPGIGRKNGAALVVLLSRWQARTQGQGTGKGLSAYVGLDPQTKESGTSLKAHALISRQGDAEMRRLLYMGALGALRGDNAVRRFYDRLVGRKKAKKVALLAAARKILVWAWAVFQSGQPFDAQRCAG